MKKIVIGILLVCGLFVSWQFLKPSPKQPKVAAHPAFWIDNQQVALVRKHDLLFMNVDKRDKPITLHEMPAEARSTDSYTRWGSCFSPDIWSLGGWRKKTTTSSLLTGAKFEVLSMNGANIIAIDAPKYRFSTKVGGFSCQTKDVFEQKDQPAKPEPIVKSAGPIPSDLTAIYRTELFAQTDATNVRTAFSFGIFVVEASANNGPVRFELASNDALNLLNPRVAVLSVRDGETANYLLYQRLRFYLTNPDHWPKTAWKIALDTPASKAVTLPAGPWVGDQFGESIKCFSCGCGCYRKLDLYYSGGNIYAHVWGWAYPVSVQGLYRLIEADNGNIWEKSFAA